MILTTLLAASAMVAPATVYDFSVKDIDGKPVALNAYRGKVLLVVNTASKCGYTPQYKSLQTVFTDNKSKGLVVLGFPANDFRAQEPGSDADIKEFCSENYQVTFPMFSKISVVSPNRHPLYDFLVTNSDKPTTEIEWNFTKFLVDRKGKVRYRFPSKTTPDSAEVVAKINELLAEKS